MGHIRKQLISIYLNATCNMACKYCVLATQNNTILDEDSIIDIDFAKKGIYDFFRDYSGRAVRYYGAGEPTIAFSQLCELTEYAQSLTNDKVYFELQTNGFFNPQKADWIKDNMSFVWISCDGLPDIQNKYRPAKNGGETSNIVERNIRYLASGSNDKIGCRATLPVEMVDRQIELIDYFCSLGVKYICVERAFSSLDEGLFEAEKQSPDYFADKYYEAFMYAREKGIFYGHLNMANFDEKVRFNCRACFPYPHLTTDGYVSCCDIAPFGKDIYKDKSQFELVYGKWDKKNNTIEYDEEKISNIRSRNVDVLRKSTCKDCEAIDYCAGGCLGQALFETGSILGKSEWNCAVTKKLFRQMPIDKGLYPITHS